MENPTPLPPEDGRSPALSVPSGSRLVFPPRGASCNRASLTKPAAALAATVMRAWADGQPIAQRARSSKNGKWYLTTRPAWNWALMQYRVAVKSCTPDGLPMAIMGWPSDDLNANK